jgi:hypothetical protein
LNAEEGEDALFEAGLRFAEVKLIGDEFIYDFASLEELFVPVIGLYELQEQIPHQLVPLVLTAEVLVSLFIDKFGYSVAEVVEICRILRFIFKKAVVAVYVESGKVFHDLLVALFFVLMVDVLEETFKMSSIMKGNDDANMIASFNFLGDLLENIDGIGRGDIHTVNFRLPFF